MNYKKVRALARTGDVMLVGGRGIISAIIRVLTGGSISHVGMLVWIKDALWIAEYKEFKGFQFRPASTWVSDALSQGNEVYYGRAPQSIAENSTTISARAYDYRGKGYGYLSLFKILVSQILGINIKIRRLVCSTFIQTMWESEGFKFQRNADPSDFVGLCESISIVRRDSDD